jgi:2-oxo-4-hydroxy-4-carboxy--5-ureidoimidazoline (OHCU) decarboxylase
MKEAFAEKLAKMFNISSTIAVEAQQATRQLSAVASNLTESGQDFVMAARAFQQSKFPQALRESVSGLLETKERITASSDSLSARMQEVRDALLVIQSQWQLLAKSAETELETCRLATQQMNAGLEQLQASSLVLGEGVEVTAVAAKQLQETRLEVMRDRKLSIEVAESVRDRLAVDSSVSETCHVFAKSLETALEHWNANVNQLDSLRHQFIQVAINGRNEDEVKIKDLAGKAQELIRSINTSLSTDLSQAITIQREALGQLGGPMTHAQQLTTDLVQQLEALTLRLDQQSAESGRRPLWGQGGEY